MSWFYRSMNVMGVLAVGTTLTSSLISTIDGQNHMRHKCRCGCKKENKKPQEVMAASTKTKRRTRRLKIEAMDS